MGLFLLGNFIDFGGAFRIKLGLTILALMWILTRHNTLRIWFKCRSDLFVLLGIPLVLGLTHVTTNPSLGMSEGLRNLYNTISAPLLLLLLPLFHLTGASRTQRMILVGMGIVALAMITLAALHVGGAIRLDKYTAWAQRYRVGFIGIDPRQPEVPANLRPVVAPRVGFTLVLGLGLALAASWTWTGLMILGLVLLMSRGMWLGAMLAVGLWFLLNRYPRRLKLTKRKLLVGLMILMAVITLPFLINLKPLIINNAKEIIFRFSEVRRVSDLNTQIRIGHLDGYKEIITSRPIGALVGFGPSVGIFNPILETDVKSTEIAALNLALWYGIPYSLLYSGWLFGSAWQLWRLRRRPDYTREDTGLIIGAVAFWIAGNTNPLMTSPMSIIALMLIRTRTLELTAHDSNLNS